MNSLHGIKLNNDLAALRGATVSYSPKTKQLLRAGQPFESWAFLNRRDVEHFAVKNGAFVKPC